MVLTTIKESEAPAEARYLLQRNVAEPSSSQAIIEMITTIMVYKFEHLSQKEIEIMLGITLQETRVYREIKAVGREEGIVVGREEGIVVGREEGREEATTNLILRQLTRRFGAISEDLQGAIAGLPLHRLEDLSEALLDFTSLADLEAWLG